MSRVSETGRGTDFFDATRLGGIAGSCASLLGKHAEAGQLLTEAIERRATSDLKGRALLILDLAATRVNQGEIEEACRLTSEGLRASHGSIVAPIRTRARAVRRSMQPWVRTHAVVALDEVLAAAAS